MAVTLMLSTLGVGNMADTAANRNADSAYQVLFLSHIFTGFGLSAATKQPQSVFRK
jgi:hypothetical protein